jgi:hypothetical protein
MAYAVPKSGWAQFCRRFLEQQQGSPITLRSRSTHTDDAPMLHPIARGRLHDLAYVREGSEPELRVVVVCSDIQESFALANLESLLLDEPDDSSGVQLSAEARDGTQLLMQVAT